MPRRIVALDLQWADVLVALGTSPVGFIGLPTADPSGLYPWQTGLDDATVLEGEVGALPYEEIAAFLQQEEEKAEQLVTEVQGQIAAVREELPGLQGKTFTLSQYIPGDGIYVVAEPDDGSSRFFSDLGLVMAPEVVAAGKEQGQVRPKFSAERVDILGADVVAFYTPVDEAAIRKELPGFDELPSVRSGAMARTSFSVIVAMNTPTPFSVAYALDELRPHLEAAAAG